jgi:PilZ domain
VDWGYTSDCGQQARLTSISVGGCFVQTPDEARPDEQIFLRLCLPEEHLLRGEVRYHMPAVGFGVMFIDMTIEDQLVLEALIASYGK